MKHVLLIAVVLFGFAVNAEADEHFPSWVTNDRAKIWSVDQLIEFQKNAEFYKIKSIDVNRYYSEENKCDMIDVKLVFDDPECPDREVHLIAWAPLCDEKGCRLYASLTTCRSNGARIHKTYRER